MNIKQKKIIRISAICLLVILFVFAGAEIWITRKIEAAIEHAIREQGGVPNRVHVGSISIYPLNRTIRLKHLVFGIDFPAKGIRIDLQMDRLTAGGIRLRGEEGMEFGSIDLDSPVVTLSRRTGETLTDTIRRDTTKSSDLHPTTGLFKRIVTRIFPRESGLRIGIQSDRRHAILATHIRNRRTTSLLTRHQHKYRAYGHRHADSPLPNGRFLHYLDTV